MTKPWGVLQEQDHEVYEFIEKELTRQSDGLELIASENFASEAVIAACGNVFTNKYAEGRPHKRYYGGCEVVDEMEDLAIKRACELFSCQFANVQPHSGAQANAAVFLALLQPGDKIMGLDLSHGGHLTHGSKVNFSGLQYESHFYQLNQQTELLDYDAIEQQALKLNPAMIIAGASAYPRSIDFKKFRAIADKVGAYLLVDMAHIAGLVAAGVHSSPLPYAHITTTTTHKTLRGPRGGLILWNDADLSVKLNKGVFPGTQGGPLEHIIAAKAVCFKEAASSAFHQYQTQVIANSKELARGLLARGHRLVSGGSDNHLVLLNLLERPYSGKDLEEGLGQVAITVNKNTVPNEIRSPFVTSGIRLGTPALTTRGFKEQEMAQVAAMIADTAESLGDTEKLAKIKQSVVNLAHQFPLYPNW